MMTNAYINAHCATIAIVHFSPPKVHGCPIQGKRDCMGLYSSLWHEKDVAIGSLYVERHLFYWEERF